MKIIPIPLSFGLTDTIYETKMGFKTADVNSAVLQFTSDSDPIGCVATLSMKNETDNSNRFSLVLEQMDVSANPFSYTLGNEIGSSGVWIGDITLKKNLVTVCSQKFRFAIGESLQTSILDVLIQAKSVDEMMVAIQGDVTEHLGKSDASVKQITSYVNGVVAKLLATDNTRTLQERDRVLAELARETDYQSWVEAVQTLIDTAVIDARVQAIIDVYQSTYAQSLFSLGQQLAETNVLSAEAVAKADAMASGSPKGVYTTLAALRTAYPTGTTGAYLVTADGKWYYWNGTAWTAGGVYQSTGLAVDGVMVDNLNAEAKNGLIEYTRAISQSDFEVFPAHFSYLTGQVNGVNTKYVQFGSPYTTYNWFKLKGSITTFIAAYSDSILPPYIVLCGNATECLVLEMSTGKIYHCTTTTSVLKTTIAVAEQIVRYDTLKIENANGVITVHVLNGAVYDLIATIDLTTIDVTFNAEYGLGFMGNASYRGEPWVYDLRQYVKNYDFLTDTDISSLQSDISTLNIFKTTTETTLADIQTDIINLGGSSKFVDLVLFMGQSNMAGRGTSAQAPTVPTGHGFEFKSISDPTKLYDIVEPFGYAENVVGSVNDGTSKTGSMVSAFANAYYSLTKVPIVGVSASQGNTGIDLWSYANNGWFIPIHERLDNAVTWLNANGYTIRHKFIVWCQGETDGDNAMTKADYIAKFKLFAGYWTGLGIEKIFIVRIGNNRDNATLYDVVIDAQTELGKTYDKCVLVSTRLANMAVEGLMKDQFHYTQTGYNIVGEDAGKNMAFYVNNLKEPIMYDSEYSNLYYSTKLGS